MKVVIQRVLASSVKVDGEIVGKIGKGLLALVGFDNNDTEADCERMAEKIVALRIFEDENGKTNLSLNNVNGSILVVSQFTLCADTKKGHRPSFINAARPEKAVPLYEKLKEEFKKLIGEDRVACGVFGADMKVEILNDGPFTLILE